MDGILRVTPQQLTNTACDFGNKAAQIQNLTATMTQKVNSLSGFWEGEAAQTYISKFNGLQDDIDKMVRMVQEHVQDLREMAANYQAAERGNESDFESLSVDVII